jgi:hypothetical protein
MRKFINIVEGVYRTYRDRLRDPRFYSYTDDGDDKPQDEMDSLAMEIALKLSPEEIAAMTSLKGAVALSTDRHIRRSLEEWGLSSGFSRSGDNAEYFTPLGNLVQQYLG